MQVTGGRNGYGAKLANIFSTEFVIETCDGKTLYKQVPFHPARMHLLMQNASTFQHHSASLTRGGRPGAITILTLGCCGTLPLRQKTDLTPMMRPKILLSWQL